MRPNPGAMPEALTMNSMSRISRRVFSFCLCVICFGTGLHAQVAETTEDPRLGIAREFLSHIIAGRTQEAAELVAPDAAGRLTPGRLSGIWHELEARHGPFQGEGINGAQSMRGVDGSEAAVITLRFETAAIDSRIFFIDDKVAAIHFVPSESLVINFVPPPYADSSLFSEEPFTVGRGDFALPGTLCIPNETGPHPLIILVSDMGPQDRDSTVGAVKPLRDLAWGLATLGVASLRYEKRIRLYATRIDRRRLTFRDEIVEDAAVAIRKIHADPRFHDSPLFVLGHGLAGQVMPEIIARSGGFMRSSPVAGAVMMAPAARPLPETLVDYLTVIAGEDGRTTYDEKSAIRRLAASFKTMLESRNRDHPSVMGIRYTYLKALTNYDTLGEAAGLKIPLWIVHGGRDARVSAEIDHELWREAMGGDASEDNRVRVQLYPKLNHAFVAGEGLALPSEYAEPAHVAEAFVVDLAAWITEVAASDD